jgi:hypothetical protein
MRASAARAARRLTKLERQSLGVLGLGATIPPSRAATPRHPLNHRAENLDQIGEQRRAAVTVVEHDFGQRKASVQDDLVNIASPCGFGHIAKLGIERKIPAFAP